MKKTLTLLTILAVATASSYSETLMWENDFEGLTAGDVPAGTRVRPTSVAADLYTKVVSGVDNPAGGGVGEGIELYDNTGSSLAFEQNFVASEGLQISLVKVSFDLAFLGDGTGDGIAFGIGNVVNSLTSSSRRFVNLGLAGTGLLDGSAAGDVSDGLMHHVDIIANDSDTSVLSYDSPAGGTATLNANKVRYYLDGTAFKTENLHSSVSTNENNFGRIGFNTSGGSYESHYNIDNIEVYNLDEESSENLLVLEDFESYTPGSKPSADRVRPSATTTNGFTTVTGSATNLIGTGQGLQMYDYSGEGCALEYNISSSTNNQYSALRVSLDFAYVSGDGTSVALGVGTYGTLLTSSGRRWVAEGFGASGSFAGVDCSDGAPRHLDVYANDSDTEELTYMNPSNEVVSLATNSVAYYVDGVLEKTELLHATVHGTTNNFGRVGLNTGSGAQGISYMFDNIEIAELTPVVVEVEGYNEWVAVQSNMNGEAEMTDNPDGDSLNNLMEYALGTDPGTADAGIEIATVLDGGTNWLYHVYDRRTDATARGLVYEVLTDDVLSGTMTTVVPDYEVSVEVDGFETVTNRISTATDAAGFIKLEVELTE